MSLVVLAPPSSTWNTAYVTWTFCMDSVAVPWLDVASSPPDGWPFGMGERSRSWAKRGSPGFADAGCTITHMQGRGRGRRRTELPSSQRPVLADRPGLSSRSISSQLRLTSSAPQTVGSGAGAVALSGDRSRSHFSPGFPCGPLHCGDHYQVLRFQPPPHRTVRAVLPHTAHRRRSPPAFGLARQSRKGLGSTTIPDKVISPSWSGDWKATTDQPNSRDRRVRLLMNSASRIRA